MADAPFGTSFGDPRKYIGQSGLGQAVKSGLLAYGMKKSGLTDWLDQLNKESKAGAVPGAAVPTATQADVRRVDNQLEPAAPPMASAPVVPPTVGAPAAAPVAPEPVQAPFTEPAPQAEPDIKPNDLGKNWLSGNVSSFANPQAQRDIVPQMQDDYTQQLASGNDYQNVPGYGKLMNFAKAMMGAA